MKSVLPSKPSELIEVAMADLAKAERSPHYAIDMGTWHQPMGEVCQVCFAGSVMAGTFEVNRHSFMGWTEMRAQASKSDWIRIGALDNLRCGELTAFIADTTKLSWDPAAKFSERFFAEHFALQDNFPQYEDNRRRWKLAMRTVQRWLREQGR